MSNLPAYDAGIQQIRGGLAASWGQTYDVRRLTAATNGSIYDAAPIISGFQAQLRIAKKTDLETQIFDLKAFAATCDNRTLQIGDLLTETGYQARPANGFIFAQFRPPRPTIWVRAEAITSITRGQPKGGQAAQQPGSGPVRQTRYIGVTKATEQVLTLTNGVYSFSSAQGATPAGIPGALAQLNRVRDGNQPQVATPLYRTHFIVYLPPIADVKFDDLDRITFANGDRYEMMSIMPAIGFGLEGIIAVVEKLAT